MCPKCEREILPDEGENKINNVRVCDDCYFAAFGGEIDDHPIGHPGRRGLGGTSDE